MGQAQRPRGLARLGLIAPRTSRARNDNRTLPVIRTMIDTCGIASMAIRDIEGTFGRYNIFLRLPIRYVHYVR